MTQPAMTARETFRRGRVEIGPFDDTADRADVKVYGTRVAREL